MPDSTSWCEDKYFNIFYYFCSLFGKIKYIDIY